MVKLLIPALDLSGLHLYSEGLGVHHLREPRWLSQLNVRLSFCSSCGLLGRGIKPSVRLRVEQTVCLRFSPSAPPRTLTLSLS